MVTAPRHVQPSAPLFSDDFGSRVGAPGRLPSGIRRRVEGWRAHAESLVKRVLGTRWAAAQIEYRHGLDRRGIAARRAINGADAPGTTSTPRSLEQREVVRDVGGYAVVPAACSAGNDTRDPPPGDGVLGNGRAAQAHELADAQPSSRSRL